MAEAVTVVPEFEALHPALWWLLGLAGVSAATGTIWRMWIGPAVKAIQKLVRAVTKIADVVEQLEPHVPDIISAVKDHPEMFNNLDQRVSRLERERGAQDGD